MIELPHNLGPTDCGTIFPYDGNLFALHYLPFAIACCLFCPLAHKLQKLTIHIAV
jgi:hypothetical protein